MKLVIHGQIYCFDCQVVEDFIYADDLSDGWHILGPAKAYYRLEGICPKCQYLNELSGFNTIESDED